MSSWLKAKVAILLLCLMCIGNGCKTITYPTSATYTGRVLTLKLKRGSRTHEITSVLAVDKPPAEAHFITVDIQNGTIFQPAVGGQPIASVIGEAHETSHSTIHGGEVKTFSFQPALTVVKPTAIVVVYERNPKAAFVFWMPVT
jgi:hypothetical protein